MAHQQPDIILTPAVSLSNSISYSSLIVEITLTHLTPTDLRIDFLFTHRASGEKPNDLYFPTKAWPIMRSPPLGDGGEELSVFVVIQILLRG